VGLTCARPFGRDKPGSSQFFEALFCFGYGFGIFGIELVTAVASMIHYDLGRHGMLRRYPARNSFNQTKSEALGSLLSMLKKKA
jgi:hypothetical protein